MKQLSDYFKLQKEIYDYFGYVEDWVVIPLDDSTSMYWLLEQDQEDRGGTISYWMNKNNAEKRKFTNDDGWKNIIYTQRFLPKYTYRGKDYTMICVDTQTDGNRFLMVFDNKKEIK